MSILNSGLGYFYHSETGYKLLPKTQMFGSIWVSDFETFCLDAKLSIICDVICERPVNTFCFIFRWASRWDIYLNMADVQIHWFSIFNSFMMVIFLVRKDNYGVQGEGGGGGKKVKINKQAGISELNLIV